MANKSKNSEFHGRGRLGPILEGTPLWRALQLIAQAVAQKLIASGYEVVKQSDSSGEREDRRELHS